MTDPGLTPERSADAVGQPAVGATIDGWVLRDPVGVLDWLGVAWQDLFLVAAEASGVDAIDGAVEDDEKQFWLAADVGLVVCEFHVEESRPIRVELGLRPWVDVKDPSLTTDVILGGREPHATARLIIQSPRITVTHSGRQRRAAFAGFVRAVMARSQP